MRMWTPWRLSFCLPYPFYRPREGRGLAQTAQAIGGDSRNQGPDVGDLISTNSVPYLACLHCSWESCVHRTISLLDFPVGWDRWIILNGPSCSWIYNGGTLGLFVWIVPKIFAGAPLVL